MPSMSAASVVGTEDFRTRINHSPSGPSGLLPAQEPNPKDKPPLNPNGLFRQEDCSKRRKADLRVCHGWGLDTLPVMVWKALGLIVMLGMVFLIAKGCQCPKLDLDPRGPRVRLGSGVWYEWTNNGWKTVDNP